MVACSGPHSKPTGGTLLQVPGPLVHCSPMVPHPGGGEQKHGDRHRLGEVMGVLTHYLQRRRITDTHPPEAHFARGGQAARVCGHNPARTTPGSEALSMAVALFVALAVRRAGLLAVRAVHVHGAAHSTAKPISCWHAAPRARL